MGGVIPLSHMMLGEVSPGGSGSGPNGMLLFGHPCRCSSQA